MSTKLEQDNYLRIQLLSYDKPTSMTERFYFLEMSTLQMTMLFPSDQRIVTVKIDANTDDNKYIDGSDIGGLLTLNDFNSFFINRPDYYIHNCDLQLEDGTKISSHDDGEVSIEFLIDNIVAQSIIENIFDKYHLDKKIIAVLKNRTGHYIAVDEKSQIIADFKDFDDYIDNGRK